MTLFHILMFAKSSNILRIFCFQAFHPYLRSPYGNFASINNTAQWIWTNDSTAQQIVCRKKLETCCLFSALDVPNACITENPASSVYVTNYGEIEVGANMNFKKEASMWMSCTDGTTLIADCSPECSWQMQIHCFKDYFIMN